MHFRSLFLFFTLLFCQNLPAQSPCDLVNTEQIFDCIETRLNVQYGTGLRNFFIPDPLNGCTPADPLFTDIFSPCNTSAAPRPLIIFIHGGGFAAGNKADFWPYCEAFARRGYVTATIQYRLSMSVLTLNRNALIRASYRAMQDARCAVRYFKTQGENQNIDTSNIFVVGYSAGALTGLNLVYPTVADGPIPEAAFYFSCGYWLGCPNCPDLGDLEGTGGWPDQNSRIKGLVTLAGGVMDLAVMDAEDQVPVLMFHGTEDATLDYDSACFLNLVPCPKIYGSKTVHSRAEALGLCTQLHTFPGAGHDLGFASDTIISKSAIFFRQLVCGENPCAVSGLVNQKTGEDWLIYPNPASQFLTIKAPENQRGMVCISDWTGRQILEKQMENSLELDISNWPTGIFFFQWTDQTGRSGSVKKLLKTEGN